MRGRTRSGDRQPSEIDGEEQNQNRPESKVWKREPQQRDEAEQAVVPAIAPQRRTNAGGDSQAKRHRKSSNGQLQSVGVGLSDDVADILIETQRPSHVAMH